MILDCFIFFNELDVLKRRLNYMYDHVDKFIIVESPTTFTGKEKKFNFEINRQLFSKWNDKIIYIKTKPLNKVLFDNIKIKRNYNFSNENWIREGLQRIMLEEELYTFEDDDIVIFSDVDEIPDMSKIDFETVPGNKIIACNQKLFIFSLDYMVKLENFWNGTIICNNKYVKSQGLVSIREFRNDHERIECGWHFTKFGGDELALDIYNSSSHAGEYNYEYTVKNKLNFDGTTLHKTPSYILESIPSTLKSF